jgi:hypothetical protein
MKRVVAGLKWVREVEGRPKGIPIGRPRGVKAFGIRYEKAIEAEIPTFARGRWFEFEDVNGRGWCQPDFVKVERNRVIVLELKHTWTEDGQIELNKLYLPVLRALYGLPTLGIVVVKRLVPYMGRVIVTGDLDNAIRLAEGHGFVVWHCLGSTIRDSRKKRPAKSSLVDLATFPY